MSILVPDCFTLDSGAFVAPRTHPAIWAGDLCWPDDWKKLRKMWAIPTRDGQCWGERGKDGEYDAEACGNCGCFTIVSYAHAKGVDGAEKVWWLDA